MGCSDEGASGLETAPFDVGLALDMRDPDATAQMDAGLLDVLQLADMSTDMQADMERPVDASVTDECDDLATAYIPQSEPPAEPPFHGTLFVDDGLIVDSDPSSFRGLTYLGQAERVMYDRRTNSFETFVPHLFEAQFGQSKSVEIQVNPEMTIEEGEFEATRYGRVIGQIPGFLFRDLDTVWLHRGNASFGGGNRNLLIHTGQGEQYIEDGLLGEVFLHEATHTSLDSYHQDNPLWLAAQQADGQSLSRYGADFPRREDLAETIPLYLTVTFWPERVSADLIETIRSTVPNRILYLDCLDLRVDILP